MKGELKFPAKAKVACQGVMGAYSGIAAERLFELADITYFKNFDGVFQAVEKGFCKYGVLPIENSSAGSVNQVYDLMKKHRFYIVRGIKLSITHNLVAGKNTDVSKITEIISHEQAIMQCKNYIEKFKDVKITTYPNTALAAKAVAFMDGRAYVIPQDVKEIAHDVLRHRIILSYEAEAENLTADRLIAQILEELKTP